MEFIFDDIKSKYVKISSIKINNIEPNIVIGNINSNYFSLETVQSLNNQKKKINCINNNKWKYIVDFCNIYQKLNCKNYDFISKDIIYYSVSRSYFKMIEIDKEFDIIHSDSQKNYAYIAEAPGGFIQAISMLRHNKFNNSNDTHTTISIKKNECILYNERIHQFKDINIFYGSSADGNINNIKTRNEFINLFKDKKADVITADGGISTIGKEVYQEQYHYSIILNEIIIALSIQNLEGSFILKMFSIHTKISISYIYILAMYYKEIYIFKPTISRSANSEKYIICKGFKGISDEQLKNIISIYDYNINSKNILSIINIQNDVFFEEIKDTISLFNLDQINYIKLLINFLNEYDLLNNNDKISFNKLFNKLKIIKSIKWIEKYKLNIHKINI